MNVYRPMQRRGAALTALLLFSASIISTTVTAAKPKRAKQATEESAIGEMISDYRSWNAVNAEPIEVSAKQLALCEPTPLTGFVDPNGPHAGGFVNVYVNPVGRNEYVGSRAPQFAPGAVIVKEKLTAKDSKGPHELGLMIKREAGYAPDTGDWQYAFVDAKGKVTETQTKLACAKCHQLQAESDYVFRRVPTKAASEQIDNKPAKGRKT